MRASLSWLLLLFLVLAGRASAQQSSRFWTIEPQFEVAADAGAKAADFYYTMGVASERRVVCWISPAKGYGCWPTQSFVEVSPIARPFVTHGRAAAAGYFVGLLAIDTFGAYELHKHGHPKLAHALLLIGIANKYRGSNFFRKKLVRPSTPLV